MAPLHDSSDLLAGEVLGEMAGNFFGRRRALEDLISLVFEYADEFRPCSSIVADRAGFLNHLLLEPRTVEAFYAAVGVESPQGLIVDGFTPQALPDRIPSAFSGAGKFRKLIMWAYDRIQQACDEYLYGPVETPCSLSENGGEIPLSFCLIMKLAERANEEVAKINQEVSPTVVLQVARKLGPIGPYRKRTGCISPEIGSARFDRQFAFTPIDTAALSLVAYPHLPQSRMVAEKINRFCNQLYKKHRRIVKEMMANLARKNFNGPAPQTGDG